MYYKATFIILTHMVLFYIFIR